MAEKKPGTVHAGMVLLAVGIVFGDIGTSPLYAFETALQAAGTSSALGVTSLILWTLFLVVTVKYVFLIMRADYHGEGGIFALMAMLRKAGATTSPRGWALSLLLVLGASLLFGDGAITPAVSVLSAIEGLGAVNPSWAHLSLPITTLILALLFFAQRFGTGRL